MYKKFYEEVELEIVYLNTQNVMVASGDGFGVDDWFPEGTNNNDNF